MPDSRAARLELDLSPDKSTASTDVLNCRAGRREEERIDAVAVEEPLEIRVRGQRVAVTMRTPGQDEELAVGFLLTEGIIRSRAEILEIAHCAQGDASTHENVLNLFLAPSVDVDFDRLTRHVFTASSCGLCGKSSIESVHQHFAPVSADLTVPAATLFQLPDRLRAAQGTFNLTGGLHAAAVFDLGGELLVLREDIGRHNAVDKVVGYGCLEEQLPFDAHILVVSGRASFEIMQKALAAKMPVVAAISAPSSLAVEFARESGQTLVGFLRGESMNIYAGAARILGA
ncbi:MAG: formate dehydrogenase accessory sulfurtransferase FdhD [Verrucomicrobia bacterium]|nr:formate dehydrogenase accessory sulfurtransferase FdhD [Verrucomicrobiota bacterium]